MKSKTLTWLELAKNDLEFAKEILENKKRPHYAAHFCHQAVEKLFKAVIQEKTNDIPLRTHNFKLLCQQAKINIPEERMKWLLSLSPHYIGTKYPEDVFKLYKQYSQRFTETLYKQTKEFFEWLKTSYLK